MKNANAPCVPQSDLPILGWHFTAGQTLCHPDNDDKRSIVIGQKLTVGEPIVPCKHGLHCSVSALDALTWAPGPILWRVELSGKVIAHGNPVDKYVASERTAVAGGLDVTPVLRSFARECATSVLHLWNAPDVVKQYLATSDESLRAAAESAAESAAWTAVRAAAWDAAETAAWNAARAAAWAAAWDAAETAAWAAAETAARAAAWNAARAAAWDAARAAQAKRFEELCLNAIEVNSHE